MATCGHRWPSTDEWWCDDCEDYHTCGDFPRLDPECCFREIILPPHPFAGWEIVKNSDYEFHVIDPDTDGEVRGSDPYPTMDIKTELQR